MSDTAFWSGANLRQRFPDLALTCACADNAGFTRYVVTLARSLPAIWGYYVGDEVSSPDHAKMKAFADSVRQLDPQHPRLFVASGNFAVDASALAPFADTAEVIGADYYPIGNSQPIAQLGKLASSVESIAHQNGKRSVVVLQAFSWTDYPSASQMCEPYPGCAHFPTRSEMRQMRDFALENSRPQFLLWYSYFDVLRTNDASGRWVDLIAAAGTDSSVGMSYRSLSVASGLPKNPIRH